MIVKSGLFYLN